ncbi:MAG: helix-turn-helix domain-containing protein [Ktedonobacteraceae bacterium]
MALLQALTLFAGDLLYEAGLPTGAIAKRLGVGQRTIQHWLAQRHGPYAGRGLPRRSPLDWSTR